MTENEQSLAHTSEVLLQRIKDNFPKLEPIGTVTLIEVGWDHQVLIVDNKLVFRFPNDDEYLQLLRHEVAMLKRLQQLVSLPIPNYTYIAPDYSFAGYPMISGIALHKDDFDRLPLVERSTVATQLAGFLSTLHTLTQKGHDFSTVLLSDMKEQQTRLKKQSQQYLPAMLSAPDFRLVQETLAETDKLLEKEVPSVLIHGDIYYEHLLWDKRSEQLGIIDFSDMNRGDPAFDFAELHEYGQDFVGEVYRYYEGPKDGEFLQRAWTYQKWVAVFMLIDHFINHKTSFKKARETFDRIKIQQSLKH